MHRYQVLALGIIERIELGVLSILERLHGVKKISDKHGFSVWQNLVRINHLKMKSALMLEQDLVTT